MRADGVRIAESPTVNIQTIYRREKLRTCGSPSRSGAEARWRRTSRAAPCPERMRGGRCAPALGSKAAKWILRRRAVRPPRFHRGRFELCWERGAWRHRLWPPPPPPPPFQRPPRPAAWKGLRGGGAGAGFSICVRNTRAMQGTDGQGGGQMGRAGANERRHAHRAAVPGGWGGGVAGVDELRGAHQPQAPVPARPPASLPGTAGHPRRTPARRFMDADHSFRCGGDHGRSSASGTAPVVARRLARLWQRRHAGYLLGRLVGSLRAWTRAAARPLSTRASLSAAGPSAAAARCTGRRRTMQG